MSDAERLSLVDYLLDDLEASIHNQGVTLQNLRVRASYILTLNGLVISFFGRDYLVTARAIEISTNSVGIDASSIIAIVSAITSLACCLKIFLPYQGWVFSHEPVKFLEEFVFVGSKIDEIVSKTDIILMRQRHYQNNDEKLVGLHNLFFWSVLSTFAQILFWLIGEAL